MVWHEKRLQYPRLGFICMSTLIKVPSKALRREPWTVVFIDLPWISTAAAFLIVRNSFHRPFSVRMRFNRIHSLRARKIYIHAMVALIQWLKYSEIRDELYINIRHYQYAETSFFWYGLVKNPLYLLQRWLYIEEHICFDGTTIHWCQVGKGVKK